MVVNGGRVRSGDERGSKEDEEEERGKEKKGHDGNEKWRRKQRGIGGF